MPHDNHHAPTKSPRSAGRSKPIGVLRTCRVVLAAVSLLFALSLPGCSAFLGNETSVVRASNALQHTYDAIAVMDASMVSHLDRMESAPPDATVEAVLSLHLALLHCQAARGELRNYNVCAAAHATRDALDEASRTLMYLVEQQEPWEASGASINMAYQELQWLPC
jgi:hypothetical protein